MLGSAAAAGVTDTTERKTMIVNREKARVSGRFVFFPGCCAGWEVQKMRLQGPAI